MRILRHQRDKGFRAPVVALGNFDGLHQGHKAIVARTIALAEETGGDGEKTLTSNIYVL